jgi:putative transposase
MKEKEKKGDFRIPDEALRKIKSQAELDDFFHDLYKQAVEGMLKAEMNEHLGYEKHRARDKIGDNSRNGFSQKTLKTNIGNIPLDVTLPFW